MKTRYYSRGLYLVATLMILKSTVTASDLTVPLASRVRSLSIQADGQYLVGHSASITRVHPEGSIDVNVAFSSGVDPFIAVENQGTVLARGFSTISRLNLEESLTLTLPGTYRTFVLQPNGNIVVLGTNSLSRILPDGTPDPSFTPVQLTGGIFTTLALQEDGKIVVAVAQGGSVLRFESNGAPDETFAAPALAPANVTSVVVQPDGKILLGGSFRAINSVPRYGVARLHTDGSLDMDFSPILEFVGEIDSLALQADGAIIVSGTFFTINGQTATNIARLLPDGSLDASFSNPLLEPNLPSIPLALTEDGSVLTAFWTNLLRFANPTPATQEFIRTGSTLTWLRGGSSPEIFSARFQSSLDGKVWIDLGLGSRIPGGWELQNASIPEGAHLRVRGYVSGTSYHIDYVPGAPLFYSQPQDSLVKAGTPVAFTASVKGLEPINFQWFKNGQPLSDANSPVLQLGTVTGAHIGSYSLVATNSVGAATSRVAQLTVIDPAIVVQPKSVRVNQGTSIALTVSAAGTDLSYAWKKDGQLIPRASSPSLDLSNPTSSDSGHYQVIITGAYGTAESDVVTVVINSALPDSAFYPRLEPTSEWFPVQSGVAFNNEIFLGGTFRHVEAPAREHLLKLREDGAIDPHFAPRISSGEVGGVAALCITRQGQLLVGGNFQEVNGQSQSHLARLNQDGSLDASFHPVIETAGLYTQVTGIDLLPDGRIVIAGGFSTVNGQPRPGLAALFSDGRLDESFNPDPNHASNPTGVRIRPDSKIITFGGDYHRLHPNGAPDFDFAEVLSASTFGNILQLASGQLLIESQVGFSEQTITRTDSNGTPDPGFSGAAARGSLEALQVNGQFITLQLGPPITNVIGNSTTISPGPYAFHRFSQSGVEDLTFQPWFSNFAFIKASRADGSFLVAGDSTFPQAKLVRLNNTEPATQALTFDGTTATWLRSGTSPEVTRTMFEFSSDNLNWTNLGSGIRIPGGWKLDGIDLNSNGILRVSGFSNGSIYDSTIGISNGIVLTMPQTLQPGTVTLNAVSPISSPVVLQISSNLQQWTDIYTNFNAGPTHQFTLTNQSAPSSFYRLRSGQ